MTNGSFSTYVSSLTPFTESGELDENGFRSHLQRMRAAGIGVYVGAGGAGEGYTFSEHETQRVLAIAAEELKGSVPVRAMGVEPRTAQEMIQFGKLVEEAGLDAMQVYSPEVGHGITPTPRELERYLTDVLADISIPAVISTHHSVGFKIPLDVFERVADRFDHVIGINCTQPDIAYVTRLVDTFRGRLEIHVGGTQQGLAVMALGGNGYLTAEGNLAPKLCVSVTDHYARGDLAASHAAFAQALRLYCENLRYSGIIRGVKAALQILGLPGGYPRPPRLPVTDAEREDIAKFLDEMAIEELQSAP
jgi:4-hydroxy-tetrahydrodipicolinate synthase